MALKVEKWILEIHFPHFTVLLLNLINKTSIGTFFQIARFLFAPTSELLEDLLYFLKNLKFDSKILLHVPSVMMLHLNNYFDRHVCPSICMSVRPSQKFFFA